MPNSKAKDLGTIPPAALPQEPQWDLLSICRAPDASGSAVVREKDWEPYSNLYPWKEIFWKNWSSQTVRASNDPRVEASSVYGNPEKFEGQPVVGLGGKQMKQ